MIEFKIEADQLVCIIPERADTPSCLSWQDDLMSRIEEAGIPVAFDMSGVTYVSSAFLRICLMVGKRTGQDRFRLYSVSPDVKKVFKIAGLDPQLQID